MTDERVLNMEDMWIKIKQLEDVIRERDDKIEELNEIAEMAKMLCQGYRKESQELQEQNNRMRATLEYIASREIGQTSCVDWSVKKAQDVLTELNREGL